MAASYNNLRSKVNRAICAYLVSQNVGTNANILPADSQISKTYPLVTVQGVRGTPAPRNTGDYDIEVHVSVKGSAVIVPNPGGANPAQQSRITFDTLLQKTNDALMMTADNQSLIYTAQQITTAAQALAAADAANNGDLANFTCINWFDEGFGMGDPSEEGCSWIEVLIFRAVCCASALS